MVGPAAPPPKVSSTPAAVPSAQPAPAPKADEKKVDTFTVQKHPTTMTEAFAPIPTIPTAARVLRPQLVMIYEALLEFFSLGGYHSDTWDVRDELAAIGFAFGEAHAPLLLQHGGSLVPGTRDRIYAACTEVVQKARSRDGRTPNVYAQTDEAMALADAIRQGAAKATALERAFPAFVRGEGTAPVSNMLPPAPVSAHPSLLPLESLEGVAGARRPAGQMFELGGVALGDRRLGVSPRVNLRAIEHPQHGKGFELNFDLRDRRDVDRVQSLLSAAGAQRGKFVLEAMRFEDGRYLIDPNEQASLESGQLATVTLKKPGVYQIDVVDGANEVYNTSRPREMDDGDAHNASFGKVRLRFYGEGAPLQAHANAAIEIAGMQRYLADQDETSRQKILRLDLLWQREPALAEAYLSRNLAEVDIAELDRVMQAIAVDTATLRRLQPVEVFPGYVTTIDPAQGEEYRRLGVSHLFHTVSSVKHLPKILGGDGLMSTEERFTRGIFVTGMSSQADLETGGADSVFCRFARRDSSGEYGSIAVIYSTESLNRLDWYAYPDDRFGTTNRGDFGQRKYGAALIGDLNVGFSANEVMFRRGLDNRYVKAIRVDSYEHKVEIMTLLEAAGVREIGGRPLAQAIELRNVQSDQLHQEQMRASLQAARVDGVASLAPEALQARYEQQARRQWMLSALAATDRPEALAKLSDVELEKLHASKADELANEKQRVAIIARIADHDPTVKQADLQVDIDGLLVKQRQVLGKYLAEHGVDATSLTDDELAAAVEANQNKVELIHTLSQMKVKLTGKESFSELRKIFREEEERRFAQEHPYSKHEQKLRKERKERLEDAGFAIEGKPEAVLRGLDHVVEQREAIEATIGTEGKDLASVYVAERRKALLDKYDIDGLEDLPPWHFFPITAMLENPSLRTRARLEALEKLKPQMRLAIVAYMIPKESHYESSPLIARVAQATGLKKADILRVVNER